MGFLTKLSADEVRRLGGGDIDLLRKVLKKEEEALITRVLHSVEPQVYLQGAGLWIRSLRKLVDPSGTTE